MSILHSEYVSPCSPVVLRRWGHDVQQDPEGKGEEEFLKRALGEQEELDETKKEVRERQRWEGVWGAAPSSVVGGDVSDVISADADHKYGRLPNSSPTPSHTFPRLFSHFPRTFISIGTAERLTRECASLVRAMARDGVEVRSEWVVDACHDVLIVPEWWWNRPKGVMEGVWEGVGSWVRGFC